MKFHDFHRNPDNNPRFSTVAPTYATEEKLLGVPGRLSFKKLCGFHLFLESGAVRKPHLPGLEFQNLSKK